MKKNIFLDKSYYVIAALAIIVLSQCKESFLLDGNNSSERNLKVTLDTSYLKDRDFLKLWDITVDIWSRVSKHSIDSVCEAANRQDTLDVVAFFDFTPSELEEVSDSVEAAVNRLFDRYPELEEMADTTDCHCGEPGHSNLDLEPICDYLEYLEESEFIQDINVYFQNKLEVAQTQGELPPWAECLALCMWQCMPLSYYPPAYFACLAACEALCLLVQE